jgi:CrcB protein
MRSYLYVAVGSAVGGVARFVVGRWLQRRLDGWIPHGEALPFPIGTLIVNVTGSFLLGLLIIGIARRSDDADAMRLLLAVGFCGGYTTFSTFSYETVALIESGAGTLATMNVAASVALSFVATFAGVALGRALLPAHA